MDKMAQYEGTVSPTFLQTQGRGKAHDYLQKLPMRLGRIIRAHKPTDDANRSKVFTEYDVMVDEGSEHSAAGRFVLSHCWMVSSFGGAADFTRSTPRMLDETDKHDSQNYGLGSQVLVLLVNASTFGGIIMGGVQHTKGEKDEDAKGHHSTWQFNGMRVEVNKDGEYSLTYKGATAPNGDLAAGADGAASGTTFEMTKDGSAKLHTANDAQHLKLDHTTKTVDVLADTDFHVRSNGTFTMETAGNSSVTIGGTSNVTVSGDITVTSSQGHFASKSLGDFTQVSETGVWSATSLGGATITSQASGITLNALELIQTNSLGVHLGLATDLMVKGTTYRAAEATLHAAQMAANTVMAGEITGVGTLLASAGAALQVVSVLHKIPSVGPILGSIPLQIAATAIIAASATLALLATTMAANNVPIGTFEGASVGYLSLKNLLD